MYNEAVRYANFPKKVSDIASVTDKTLGQTLFILLPGGAQAALKGSDLNPYHLTMSELDVAAWIQTHVVLRAEHEIIAITDGAGGYIWRNDL